MQIGDRGKLSSKRRAATVVPASGGNALLMGDDNGN